ncbi:MAG TPA: SOS response-associated peptidase [Acidimicrobiia bacterium]|jgi:putative SOS response-associated peptidase YedK|nr:SOS response-associated peptidase [Acidimicrobiia bacterium]
MCGRFSITGDLDFYAEYFGVDDIDTDPIEPSWNVAPTDPVYVVAESDGRRRLRAMRWGLVPHWAPDTRSIHINARAETVATTAAFRDSFARKRCLIPADGFYEWEPPGQGRTPHWVYRADGHPMVFAGIWSTRLDPGTGEWHRTCSIITTGAEGVIAGIHDRMPVSLPGHVWDPWLDRDLTDPEAVLSLLQPIDPDEIMEHTVSSRVNSVRNNTPDLRDPAVETLF